MLHFLSPPPAYFAERLRVVLRESFTQAEKLGTFEVGPISWRDYYGVFENLPFHQGDAPNYFEASDGLRLVSDEIWPVAAPEAQFTEGYDRGPVLFTPAFTVFHEGTAAHLLYTGFPSNAELRSIDLLSRPRLHGLVSRAAGRRSRAHPRNRQSITHYRPGITGVRKQAQAGVSLR